MPRRPASRSSRQRPAPRPVGGTAPDDAAAEAPRAIDQLHRAWIDAIARGDAEALRDLVTEDYEAWSHATPPFRGRDAVVAAMAGAIARFDIAQSLERVELVVSGDWAFERAIEMIVARPRAGGEQRTQRQRALLIMHRGADGRWRYARGMTNGLPDGTASRELRREN